MTLLQDNSLIKGMSQLTTQDSDDDQPLTHPIRPAHFIKSVPQFPPANSNISQELKSVQALYERYSQKVYLEGYVEKKNDLTVEGKACQEPWSRWYMELCGPVLALWPDIREGQVMPQFVNIINATVDLFEEGNQVFSLNSAGANRFLFSTEAVNQWISAIRLSCFESGKIQEIYTHKLLVTQSDLLSKPVTKMEGMVQVRFEGAWEKNWVVVSSDKSKKIFGGKKKSGAAKISFYESKKAKTPIRTLVNVVQAHVIYPEPPQSIDLATVFKIKGNTEEKEVTGFFMVPASELAPWVVSILDSFKLNGRPLHLLDDSSNPQALNFGESIKDPFLFLSLPEVLNDPDYVNILQQKVKNQKQRISMRPQMGLIHHIPGGGNNTVNNINNINNINMAQRAPISNQRTSSPSASLNIPQKSPLSSSNVSLNIPQNSSSNASINAPRRVTYASDEEEEEDEDESESDSDESITKPRSKQESLPTLTTSEEGSFGDSILQDIGKSSQAESSKGKQPESQEEKAQVPRSKKTQISDSDEEEDEDEEDEEDEMGYSESDDDVPIHQARQTINHNQPMYNDQYMYQGQYTEEGYPITEDGPVIPQLGDHFATHNSLLDTFKPDNPSARDQEGYARAMGQPLIQVPYKPPEPRSGLVGMISQIENEKKQKETSKVRLLDRERIMERERERYLMEQRAQQPMPPMMGSGMMNQPMMNSMPNMPMMQQGQMPTMGMMGQPMMYPMMNMPMMYPMMDPHMSMMMMQQQYGQYNPMWNNPQMYGGSQYNEDEDDDEDDDVPLGVKESTQTNHKQ